MQWQKSSYCAGGECVELAVLGGQVLLRNSGKPGVIIRYTAAEWRAFMLGMQAREFDDIFVS
jgi:Domain of unknown function (DUF397)